MTYQIRQEGTYELYRSIDGHRILLIGEEPFRLFANQLTANETPQGELVVADEINLTRDETMGSGNFLLVEFDRHNANQSILYLFLKSGEHYEELYLPQGLPEGTGEGARYLYREHTIHESELTSYLQSSSAGATEEVFREEAKDEPPIENYFDLTAGDLAARIREMQPAELRELQEFEERHKNRSTILNTIRHRLGSH